MNTSVQRREMARDRRNVVCRYCGREWRKMFKMVRCPYCGHKVMDHADNRS